MDPYVTAFIYKIFGHWQQVASLDDFCGAAPSYLLVRDTTWMSISVLHKMKSQNVGLSSCGALLCPSSTWNRACWQFLVTLTSAPCHIYRSRGTHGLREMSRLQIDNESVQASRRQMDRQTGSRDPRQRTGLPRRRRRRRQGWTNAVKSSLPANTSWRHVWLDQYGRAPNSARSRVAPL